MKRKIRMTESDLRRIVKKAINEIASDNQNNDQAYYNLKRFADAMVEAGCAIDNLAEYIDDYDVVEELTQKISDFDMEIWRVLGSYMPELCDRIDNDE